MFKILNSSVHPLTKDQEAQIKESYTIGGDLMSFHLPLDFGNTTAAILEGQTSFARVVSTYVPSMFPYLIKKFPPQLDREPSLWIPPGYNAGACVLFAWMYGYLSEYEFPSLAVLHGIFPYPFIGKIDPKNIEKHAYVYGRDHEIINHIWKPTILFDFSEEDVNITKVTEAVQTSMRFKGTTVSVIRPYLNTSLLQKPSSITELVNIVGKNMEILHRQLSYTEWKTSQIFVLLPRNSVQSIILMTMMRAFSGIFPTIVPTERVDGILLPLHVVDLESMRMNGTMQGEMDQGSFHETAFLNLINALQRGAPDKVTFNGYKGTFSSTIFAISMEKPDGRLTVFEVTAVRDYSGRNET